MFWWLVDSFLDGDRRPLVVILLLVAALVALVVMYE
jgi:hypothetical protein